MVRVDCQSIRCFIIGRMGHLVEYLHNLPFEHVVSSVYMYREFVYQFHVGKMNMLLTSAFNCYLIGSQRIN